MWAYNLSPSQCDEQFIDPKQRGNLTLEVEFANNIASPLVSDIIIDKVGKVLTMFDCKSIMNTFELETTLKRNITPQEIFLGVIALDGLPKRSDLRHKNQSFLVCNCCPSTQIGHHWIAVFYDHGSIDFF